MQISPHARRALKVIAIAFSVDAGLGWLFACLQHIPVIDGLYYAVTTASTVGYGDITPTTGPAKVVTVVMELTVIPLFAAAYSLMTAGLTTAKITDRVNRQSAKRHEETLSKLTSYIEQKNNRTNKILLDLKEDPYWPGPPPDEETDSE